MGALESLPIVPVPAGSGNGLSLNLNGLEVSVFRVQYVNWVVCGSGRLGRV